MFAGGGPVLRDYERWHERYDDPGSDLSWRLGVVRGHIRAALDRHPGPVRALSLCAGDGRDLLGVLAGRPDAARVRAVLVEVHPAIAERARRGAAGTAAAVDVREADAGDTGAYADAVPAELVLLVGIMGNVTDADLARTIAAAPALCAPGGRWCGRAAARAATATAWCARGWPRRGSRRSPTTFWTRTPSPPSALPATTARPRPLPAGRVFTFRR